MGFSLDARAYDLASILTDLASDTSQYLASISLWLMALIVVGTLLGLTGFGFVVSRLRFAPAFVRTALTSFGGLIAGTIVGPPLNAAFCTYVHAVYCV